VFGPGRIRQSSAINNLAAKGVPIRGTSAGNAILAQFAYSATPRRFGDLSEAALLTLAMSKLRYLAVTRSVPLETSKNYHRDLHNLPLVCTAAPPEKA
jgi:cyanophycinase-like exopeptidase